MVKPLAKTIRAKKLGVLIRDARVSTGKSVAECAQALGISTEAFEAYELGDQSPSLPELEVLAYTLEVPLAHFWGDSALSAGDAYKRALNVNRVVGLRQRKIGALLRQARLQADLSLEEASARCEMTPEALEAFELGDAPISLPNLEALLALLDRPMREFQDHHGPVGEWIERQRALEDFMELPADLRAFVAKPINRPYIELALRLSEMDVNRLRSVAEGLLEITL
ncbi:MAG TPA: helix-turn-helix transcriptional regulator [Anaerolineales bacterium]|nr:helix-turn-helix transcriptional regulator [Anaerolineales bacterium]